MLDKIFFTKLHGLGNDFILLDDLKGSLSVNLAEERVSWCMQAARYLCHRRFGIGADQLLWLYRVQDQFGVEIWNPDGSQAEMCGNGIRAIALYLRKQDPKVDTWIIQTLGGKKIVRFLNEEAIQVDMGIPQVIRSKCPITWGDQKDHFYEIHVGNPHAVFFVPSVQDLPLKIWGPLIENHSFFPQRINVEFVENLGDQKVRVRVWERGAGITLACGTGACAAAVASCITQQVVMGEWVQVELPGGSLRILWKGPGSSLTMVGGATWVYSGDFLWDPPSNLTMLML